MEHRQALLEASKKASKTTNFLRIDTVDGDASSPKPCYCIMGLACEVFRQQTGRGEWRKRQRGFGYVDSVYEFLLGSFVSVSKPPAEVYEYFGLDLGNVGDLIRINDGCGTATLEDLAKKVLEYPIKETFYGTSYGSQGSCQKSEKNRGVPM